MDNATRKICSAISFGVFLRAAPSTIAIILSRKLCPASLVTWMMSQSDSTVVPPVTALRSPPLSRMTGADSPVIADSSTEAAPSMTSPSAGICSPAWTITRSPFLRSAEETGCISARFSNEGIRCAVTSFLAERSAAAWALPRPSASASAKFAKNTVNQSSTAMLSVNQPGASAVPQSPAR